MTATDTCIVLIERLSGSLQYTLRAASIMQLRENDHEIINLLAQPQIVQQKSSDLAGTSNSNHTKDSSMWSTLFALFEPFSCQPLTDVEFELPSAISGGVT
jgi:hypothetical protein